MRDWTVAGLGRTETSVYRYTLGRNDWLRLNIPQILKMFVLFPLAEIILKLERWAPDPLEL